MKQTATLTLIFVNPLLNRHRQYNILLHQLSNEKYLLVCAWGRIGQKMKTKSVIFGTEPELIRYLQALLNRRFRHRYIIRHKSAAFPNVPALLRFDWENNARQLQLFDDEWC